MVSDSMAILRKYPLSGAGAGAYEVAYPPYQSWVSDGIVDHAHNDYAELLAETGSAGGLLLIAFLYLFIRQSLISLTARPGHPAGWMQTGATIACCGLLVHSFTDFNFHIPANAAWFSFAAGLATSAVLGAQSA